MGAVLTQIRATLARRRAQTAIVLVVCLLAASVSTMALTILVRVNQPWDDAFAQVNGAHLVFHLDAARVTAAQLAATASVPGVTAAGPPLETAAVPFTVGAAKGPIQVIGRESPGGEIGRLVLAAGRWPQRPGEIAVGRFDAFDSPLRTNLGDTIRPVSGAPMAFTVVGEVIDLNAFSTLGSTTRAWVLPGEVAELAHNAQVRLEYEMPYRFQRAATSADLAADRRALEAVLPAGSEAQPPSTWLDLRAGANWLVEAVSGVVFAFAVLALLAVALIVASVVAGSVVSGYREIGIIKALGFTPAEVALTVVGQMAAPALAGALLGIPVGALISRPFLLTTASALRLPTPSAVDPAVDASVPVGLLLLVVLAALVPALRAARTNSVHAIAMGSAPPAARRSWLTSGLARLGVPRPLSLGAGDAIARPLRSALTLLALAIGIATITFAFTFGPTIQRFADDRAGWGAAQDLNVTRYPALSDSAATALLTSQPETESVIATHQFLVAIAGQADAVPLIAMRGDAPGFGYHALVGRWFGESGEAVVASLTARDAHIRVGDSVSGTVDGRPVQLRVVGIHNDITTGGRGFRVGWDTVATLLTTSPDLYLVKLPPGADAWAFASRVAAREPDALSVEPVAWAQWAAPFIALLNTLVGGLTLVLALIAAAGVFNATLLSTRERLRDIATLKALGMTPRQIGVMAAASALVLALIAAVIGIPVGMVLLGVIVGAMGDLYGFVVSSASLSAPTAALVVGGAFVVALAGAAVPARWAAAVPVTQVLRSE